MTTTVETAPASIVNFTDDTQSFKRIYQASRRGFRVDGQNPLRTYFDATPNVSVTRGRRFGIEIELNNDMEPISNSECECYCICEETCDRTNCNDNCTHDNSEGRVSECHCECLCYEFCDGTCYQYSCECHMERWSSLVEWMFDNGYISEPFASSYHDGAGLYEQWRYEADSTVTGGEVITPVLDDSGASWATVKRVMDKAYEFGCTAHERNVGGHISIDVPDMRDNVDMLLRLMTLVQKFEDVMYRLATNPERAYEYAQEGSSEESAPSRHRGLNYAPTLGMVGGVSNAHIPALHRARWMSYSQHCNRLEFRIFDGTLDASTSQTFAMIAAAFVDAAARTDIDERLATMPDRIYGWHVEQRREAGFQARTALSGDAWEKDTQAIREFVDLLFDNDQDKERVITLFALNDWSKRN